MSLMLPQMNTLEIAFTWLRLKMTKTYVGLDGMQRMQEIVLCLFFLIKKNVMVVYRERQNKERTRSICGV